MRIDAHAHILPSEWPDLLERYGDPRWPTLSHLDACSANIMVGGEIFRRVTLGCYDVDRRLEEMAETDVDMQILSTVPVMFSYWAPPEQTRELGRYLNEHMAEVVRRHPDRFRALGTIPMNDPDMAVEELDRCVRDYGMAGVEIGTNIAGLDLDDPRFFPFFERAATLGITVFVHPWQVVGAGRLAKYYFLYTVAMPSETAFAVGAVLFSGLLERLPALKLLFAHGGGSVPHIIGRMQRGWDVWAPAREQAALRPDEQLRRCWFDSVTWDATSLEMLVGRVGADRVVLGSDYPFIMGEERPGTILEQTQIDPQQRRMIQAANAQRLFGIAGAEPEHEVARG